QDAFHIRRIAKELNTLLVESKVNRVLQTSKDEVHLLLYTGSSTVRLLLSTHATFARVGLTTQEKEPLAVAPNFCMLLRKHLQGAKILSVEQVGFERIIAIRFFCLGDFSQSERTLYCELMGKYSNLVLVENGVTLGALKTTSLGEDVKRVLFAGVKYAFPEKQEKAEITDIAALKEVDEGFNRLKADGADSETLAEYLFSKVAGIALSTAREVVKRKKEAPVYEFLPDFCFNEPCVPHLISNGEEPSDFFAFEVQGGEKQPSLNKAQDVYYSARENKKAFEGGLRKLLSAATNAQKKCVKKLEQTSAKLAEAELCEENKIKGELLTANLYAINSGASFVELDNWYSGEKIKIRLDPTLSPSKNAQRYFKTYQKQKRAKETLLPRKQEEEKELYYLETVLFSLQNAKTEADIKEIEEELLEAGLLRENKKNPKKKKDLPQEYRKYQVEGFCVLVGRNNLQNDRLLKESRGEDLWFHAQKYHSAFVVLKTEGKPVLESAIKQAAEICAYYSQGRLGDKIPVDYCEKKYVKKPPKSRPGFVIYTDYKTALAEPKLPKEE
ncbi:MAG: NFACT family protein, partial [Clostridia bacterium]|nr:NFACT family protein [Clostridia bacterium]